MIQPKEVLIEVIADSKLLIIIFTCPYCNKRNEGIQSEIPVEIEKDFLNSLKDNRGCETPCPNCGKMILLKVDERTRDILKSDKWSRN